MSKLTNLFEDFRQYQSKKVDSPYYEPLGQSISVGSPAKKENSRKEYQKAYYQKNKEKIRKYQRDYRKKRHEDGNHRGDMSGIQKKVYEYLLAQYRKGEDPARGTEIARALGISENSVYTAVFQLTKKGYLGRGAYGRYLLLKFPDGEGFKEEDEIKKELEVMGETFDEPEMVYVEEDKYDEILKENESLKKKVQELEEVASKKPKKHIDGEDYSPGYVSYLKSSIKTGEKIISELKERVVYLEEQLEKVQVVEVNEENKSDYLKKLESQNSKFADEVIMLRKIVKYLSRYID